MTVHDENSEAPKEKPSGADSFDLPGFAPQGGKSSGAPRPERPRSSEGPKRYPDSGQGRGRPPAREGGRPSYGGSREGGRPPYGGGRDGAGRDGGRPSYGGSKGGGYGYGGSRSGGDREVLRPGSAGGRPAYNKPDRRGDRNFDSRGGGNRPYGGGGGQRDFRGPSAPRSFEPEISAEVSKYLPLKHEKGRYRESRFLIEGAKNIADVVAVSPGIIYTVLVAKGFEDEKLRAALNYNRVHTQEVSPRDLAALCDTETPQGIVAVASFGALKPDWASANVVTLVDGVQDPGNIGSILRTSAALGVDAVVLGKGTCDAYNPKVVRASAAALLRVPLETGEDLGAKIQFLRLKGFSVVATSPHAQITLSQAKLRRKVALLFGNEGAGVGLNFLDQADAIVRIPMRGKIESLNVAVAHGLLTYELMRLREKS